MKSIVAVLIVGLFAVPAAGGEEDPARILERLASAEVREMAWGAWLSGERGLADAVPRLVDILRLEPGRAEPEWDHLRRNVFDALIRLDARVPRDALVPWLSGRFSTPALVLAAREPAAVSDLLLGCFRRFGDDAFGPYPVAVGNLLAAAPPPGFARELLLHVPLSLRVTVTDPGSGIGGGGGGRVVGGFGDGRVRIPEGFPPWVGYDLTFRENEGTILAPGPRPVRYVRIVKEKDGGFGSGGGKAQALACRLEWLAVLLRAEPGMPVLDPSRSIFVAWAGPDAYLAEVAAARERLLRDYRDVARRLREFKLLTEAEEKALDPAVAVEVVDRREGSPEPLPDLPPVR